MSKTFQDLYKELKNKKEELTAITIEEYGTTPPGDVAKTAHVILDHVLSLIEDKYMEKQNGKNA